MRAILEFPKFRGLNGPMPQESPIFPVEPWLGNPARLILCILSTVPSPNKGNSHEALCISDTFRQTLATQWTYARTFCKPLEFWRCSRRIEYIQHFAHYYVTDERTLCVSSVPESFVVCIHAASPFPCFVVDLGFFYRQSRPVLCCSLN